MRAIDRPLLLTAAVLLVVVAAGGRASAQALTTIRDNGPSANRLDLVVLGDGYTQSELPQYAAEVEFFIEGLFAGDVFSEYRNYFNVHRIDVVSHESGADHPSRTPAVFRDTALDGTFDCNGIQRLTCVNTAKVFAILSGIPPDQRDLVLVMLNDPEYGGSGGTISVVSTHASGVEATLHEMGHTLGLLADEYGGPPPPSCNNSFEPFEVNVTRAAGGPLKWAGWIAPGTPLPTPGPTVGVPGLYEGAKYCDTGLFRPTYNSKMRSLFVPFEQINTEQLIKRIYNFVSPIDDASPAAATIALDQTQSQSFAVSTTQPQTRALEAQWVVDDAVVATGPTFTLNGASLAAGTHSVQVLVHDATPLVRGNPAELADVHEWTVIVAGSGTGGGATATFVAEDPATQGSWRGIYGRDSAALIGDTVDYPAYAQVAVHAFDIWTWDATSADPRALERSVGTDRVAATWYGNVVDIDVRLNDGRPHRLALYALDFDFGGRSQRIDVRDAESGVLLDSRTLTDFTDGRYLVWQLTGHVSVQLTRLEGPNAVISGLFFDPPVGTGGRDATARFVTADVTTKGSWHGVYGHDGGAVVGGDVTYPSYAHVSTVPDGPWTWENDSADPRALQRGSSASRVAATWFGNTVTIDVDLIDGQPHRLALYAVDFDFRGRRQRVDVRDGAAGTLLDSQTLTDFTGGQYLVWQVTGHVILDVTRLDGDNAVVSGLFFDAPDGSAGHATATFVSDDAATQGSWHGVYGSDGGAVVGDAAMYPAYAQVAITDAAPWTWIGNTTDERALETVSGSTRLASTVFGQVMHLDIDLTDGQAHRVAFYSVDFDFRGRSQRVDVRDAATGALLDSRTLTDFTGGRYLVWQLTGHVVVEMTRLDGDNAVVSGLFFDPATLPVRAPAEAGPHTPP
jgi:hypothetical protein